jgi:hypothetical protein
MELVRSSPGNFSGPKNTECKLKKKLPVINGKYFPWKWKGKKNSPENSLLQYLAFPFHGSLISFLTVLLGNYLRRNFSTTNVKELRPTVDKLYAEQFNAVLAKETETNDKCVLLSNNVT